MLLLLAALPFLSPVFGDNMVLQRDRPNTFWGWSVPGDHVVVHIGHRTGDGVANDRGRWQATIQPPEVGTAVTVSIDGAHHTELHNVIVGDVWLCGGQSNMEFPLVRADNGAAEAAAADHPLIRWYRVASRSAYAPTEEVSGHWSVCTPQTATQGLSAVAYYFARRVQAQTGVPIGLVQDCLGGTPVECWTAPSTLAATGNFAPALAEIRRLHQQGGPEYGNYIMHWYDEYDAGARGATWAEPSLDDHEWRNVDLSTAFAQLLLADAPAVCWFRKEITLPSAPASGQATLRLGEVEKMETSYVNGHFVGASSWVENPRVYSFAANLLHPGRNVIALRVFKLRSRQAFLSGPTAITLTLGDGRVLPLDRDWKAKVSVDARPRHPLPLGFENYPIMPGVLYNGMIAPVAPLALKGALWYQGEANTTQASAYAHLLSLMIGDWRRAFGQGDFPFLIVQLPAFQARRSTPGTDGWTDLREAQAKTAAAVKNCGLAVTVDTGDADNIHPRNKQPVGERLALIALAQAYGVRIPSEGPTFKSMRPDGSALRVQFSHADGGLVVHGDRPAEFSLAGPDHVWHWAQAQISGKSAVRVWAPGVPQPVAVRYAWQANPAATLFNGAGLPAAPFRTDDW